MDPSRTEKNENEMATMKTMFVFGGDVPWLSDSFAWKAINDSIRGGKSTSHLTLVKDQTIPNSQNENQNDNENQSTDYVLFSGTLDFKTLGGAGFASQSTSGTNTWDLSAYDGLRVELEKGDGKMYTLIVKDEVPEEEDKREDGREKAGVNWEYEFRAGKNGENEKGMVVDISWKEFKATFRGKEKKDAKALKSGEIRRFSLMMRSFFGTQEGKFEVTLRSISAFKVGKNGGED